MDEKELASTSACQAANQQLLRGLHVQPEPTADFLGVT